MNRPEVQVKAFTLYRWGLTFQDPPTCASILAPALCLKQVQVKLAILPRSFP